MRQKTKVTQFVKKTMCHQRLTDLLAHGNYKCMRKCYAPFTVSEVLSLRQAFHQLHHTEHSFLIQTMRSDAKKTVYTMNGHLVCLQAFHNLIGTGS